MTKWNFLWLTSKLFQTFVRHCCHLHVRLKIRAIKILILKEIKNVLKILFATNLILSFWFVFAILITYIDFLNGWRMTTKYLEWCFHWSSRYAQIIKNRQLYILQTHTFGHGLHLYKGCFIFSKTFCILIWKNEWWHLAFITCV